MITVYMGKPRRDQSGHGLLVWAAIVGLVLSGCERAPAEPSPPSTSQPTAEPDSTEATSTGLDTENTTLVHEPAAPEQSEPTVSKEEAQRGCIDPLEQEPPPAVDSLEECPVDPGGRPTMPWGKVRMPEGKNPPELKVELALTVSDQRHGLMFRPTLDDSEGMLFTYPDEGLRRFWMHNTCLALDMIHIDASNRIVGIVENVPPWNDLSRSVSCPAMHVLEVPAGWARRYDVRPGQIVEILPTTP